VGAVRGGGAFGLGGNVAEPGTVMAGSRRGWASMEAAAVVGRGVSRSPRHWLPFNLRSDVVNPSLVERVTPPRH